MALTFIFSFFCIDYRVHLEISNKSSHSRGAVSENAEGFYSQTAAINAAVASPEHKRSPPVEGSYLAYAGLGPAAAQGFEAGGGGPGRQDLSRPKAHGSAGGRRDMDLTRMPGAGALQEGSLTAGLFAGLVASLLILLVMLIRYRRQTRCQETVQRQNRQLEAAAEKMSSLVYISQITDLPNRRGFNEKLARTFEICGSEGDYCSVAAIDLDHFKTINDSYGHEFGDAFLAAMGARLAEFFAGIGFAAHISGDEFAVIMRHERKSEKELARLCKALLKAATQPIAVRSLTLEPSLSIGIGQCRISDGAPETVLTQAGYALHRRKRQARGGYQIYDPGLAGEARRSEELGAKLRAAIAADRLQMQYQPKVDFGSGAVVGLEALVRWPDAEKGCIAASELFDVAECHGLVHHVSNWIFKCVARDMRRWRSEERAAPRVAVNMHPVQLKTANELFGALSHFMECGIENEALMLEFTEACVTGRGTEPVPALLWHLSKSGYGLSLDDFGTGLAALIHLKTLPVDEIKIDGSFVAGMLNDEAARTIVDAVIELARRLGIAVVAEGVESADQQRCLRQMGCETGQGHYFLPAVHPDVVAALLENAAPFSDRITANAAPSFRARPTKPVSA